MEPCPHCKQYEHHANDCATVAMSLVAKMRCPDCGAAMRAIRMWPGPAATPYFEIQSSKSWITGMYPTAGFVYAACCNDCRGVRMFTVPNERPAEELLPIPAEREQQAPNDLPLPSDSRGEA